MKRLLLVAFALSATLHASPGITQTDCPSDEPYGRCFVSKTENELEPKTFRIDDRMESLARIYQADTNAGAVRAAAYEFEITLGRLRAMDIAEPLHDARRAIESGLTDLWNGYVLGAPEGTPGISPTHWSSSGALQQSLISVLREDPQCFNQTPEQAPEHCDALVADAIELGKVVGLTRAQIRAAQDGYRRDVLDALTERSAAWDVYLYSLGTQYWWELRANRIYNTWRYGFDEDEMGNPIGMRPLPYSRLILLHPDIGLMYFPDASRGDRLKPSLTIQWFGLLAWDDYTSDGVTALRGMALTSTFADRAQGRAYGIGLTTYIGNSSFAVTHHGSDDYAVTVNLGLGRRLFGME